jgi:DNA-binding transcriptional MerR regulator
MLRFLFSKKSPYLVQSKKGKIMQDSNENLYSIQFVSNVTGINPHTIRAWEKRYGATKPVRDRNGRRLYSDEEISRLEVLHKLVSQGNSISDIATMAKEDLDKVLKKYSMNEPEGSVSKDVPEINIDESLKNIFMSIKFFKLDVFSHELHKASLALSSTIFALKIVNPIISEIRKLKGSGEMHLEQREQIYILLKSYLTKKMFNSSEKGGTRGKVLVASAHGQLNELGSMVAAILFQDKKFEVEYLGGNVNAKVLGKLSGHFKSDMIFIGLNYSHDVVMSLADKNDYLKNLAIDLDHNTKVLIGAHDYCFQLPHGNMECFNDLEELTNYLNTLS